MKALIWFLLALIECNIVFLLQAQNLYQPALKPVALKNYHSISTKNQINIDTNLSRKNPIQKIFNVSAPRNASKTLIPIRHPWTPINDNVYLLTSNYTWNKLTRRFFAPQVRMDFDGLLLDNIPEHTISIHVDPEWNRIIYASKSGNWVRSYGDNTGEHFFGSIRALSVDANDTIFIADDGSRKIIKMVYNRNIGRINYLTDNLVEGIAHPIDIAIDLQGSLSAPQNPANDHIWIADDFQGKLVDIHRDGQVYQTITHYNIGGGNVYRLNRPVKVQTQDNDKIAFIDGERNAFVIVTRPSPYVTTAQAVAYNAFDAPSKLSCIGLDINNEWWVGDEIQRQYHHFTSGGQYLCSYTAQDDPPGQFASPVSVSKAPYLVQNGQVYRSLYVYTSDLWGDNTGMRAFLPGADILDLTNPVANECDLNFSFWLTNKARLAGTLLNEAGTSVIATYDFGERNAGWQTVSINRYALGNTSYKFRLGASPYYVNEYPYEYRQGGLKEKVFTNTPPQISGYIAPIPANQACFSLWSYGWWKVVTPCSGPYKYTWYKKSQNTGNVWVMVGSPNSTNPEIAFQVLEQAFQLKCEIKHDVAGGATVTTAVYENCPPPPPPPPSCPFVYTWNGSEFVEDNNILPQSEYAGNEGKDVTDYYRLLKPLQKKNGAYVLQIREYEHERSYFDNFKLIAVDHNANTKIDVAADGAILQYRTPNRLKRARFKGADVTQRLLEFDSLKVSVYAGDTVSLDLSDSTGITKGMHEGYSIPEGGEGGGDGIPKATKIAAITYPGMPASQPATFTFRQRSTLVFVPMSVTNLRDWKITWDGQARLDYFNYGTLAHTPTTVRELTLLKATHSAGENILDALLANDTVYAMLEPGEHIELRFAGITNPSAGKKRTFILVSQGRYEKLVDSSDGNPFPEQPMRTKVTAFNLSANYPNPFNPVTSISFQTPVDGHALVVIYNTVGQEVARLFDREITEGTYTAHWNAGDASSGIYFCRYLVTGEHGKELYSNVRKLLLMR